MRVSNSSRLPLCAASFCVALVAVVLQSTARAGTVTVETNILASTPAIVGYDSGHFWPGSDTADWWRYSGVTGARIFVSPTIIEPASEFPSVYNTVTNQASFLSLKALVRANPWNTAYLNWSYVTNQFATSMAFGSDYLNVDYALSTLQQLGVQTVIDSTATTSEFTDVAAWPGAWQLWQYYYQEAFYLGYMYNVERYQMYNEPDDGGPTEATYLTMLQLASDAVQSAIADVNTMYGKSLTPIMLAPVTAGGVTSTYDTWGKLVVTNRHVNFLGQTNTNFWLIQKYDYHQYGGSPPSPSSFGSDLTYLEGQLSDSMSPETPFPPTITEFNVYDGSEFNSLSSTLDTPTNYSAFGAIAVNLIEDGINEIYCFKISQTDGSGYIAKNGTHYLDNSDVPYNIGGITEGGEVWRLINKGFSPGRNRLNYQTDSQTSALNLLASYDPVAQRYYLLSVNDTTASVALTVNMSAWHIPTNNQILVEAVNTTCNGAGLLFTTVGATLSVSSTQGANSVWLFTVPAQAQMPTPEVILADANAQVVDGANKNINYAGSTNLLVVDNSTNTSDRSAAFLQFQVPAFNPADLQLALLTLTANASASTNGSDTVLAYVYGILSNNWSENSLTWANAPNLAQGIPAGTAFTDNFVLGAGSTAFLQGQLVAGSSPSQYTIDVTSFLKSSTSTNVSFLLERGVRFAGDAQDGDGVSIVSREGSSSLGPRLQLVFNAETPTFSGLTASQSATYGKTAITLAGKVSATSPATVYPASGETISVTINGNRQTTTVNDSTGDFSFSYNPSTVPYSASAYTITYAYAGDAALNPATNTSTTLTVNRAPLGITASAQSKTYGSALSLGTSAFTSSGLQNGETVGSVTLTASGSPAGTATNAPVGNYAITPSAATGGTFNAANYTITYNTNTLTANAAALSITASAQSKTYGSALSLGTSAFASSGLQNGETVGSVTLTASGSPPGTATAAPVGTYAITPSLTTGGTFTAANYSIAYYPGTLTVNPAVLTVIADDFSQPYGATNPMFTVTYTNFVNGETLGTSDVAGSPALSTGATTNSPVGVYDITNSLGTLTSTNYSFNLVDGILTVTNALSTNVLSSSANPALPGVSIMFTAMLSTLAPSLAVPCGSVQFQIDGSPFGGPVILTNGAAGSTGIASLSHGYHAIEADYPGGTNIVGSTNTLIELINTPPVAGPASYSRQHNVDLIIAIADLLTNATDADGDAISLVAVSATSTNGAVISTNATDIFYIPPATNGNATDSFFYTVADIYGATSSNLVIVTTFQPDSNGPPANITGINTNGNGTVTIDFAGIPGLYYLIQAATNLNSPVTWAVLATNMAGTNDGLFGFTDLDATNYSSRFYRTAIP
jgi:hypothetical protein